MSFWIRMGLVVLALVCLLLWAMRFETTVQLFWFLGVIVFLWAAVQLSLWLRPRNWRRYAEARPLDVEDAGEGEPIVRSWAGPKSLLERLFPGGSLPSGTYNRGNRRVWDGNESLPPDNV